MESSDGTATREISAAADESDAPFGRDLQAGSRFGRYEVRETIGSGGMGVVLRAFDPKLERDVALKLLRRGVSGSTSGLDEARILREAQTMAKLSHPNVLPIYDVGREGTTIFIAMELVRGRTLRAWMRERRRSWSEVLPVFIAAARGLAAAHAAGLVHRDFKPSNVLVGDDERIRVMDFGLARPVGVDAAGSDRESAAASSANSELTQSGVVMGTPQYMAPEQRRGQPLDGRADQYSFCVTLYEAIHGVRPGASDPAPVDVPPALARTIARGLEPDPDARWPDMPALVRALEGDARSRRSIVPAVVLGGLALVGFLLRPGADLECEGAAERLDGIWDDATRARVHGALAGHDRPYARTTADAITTRLDAFAATWGEVHRTACVSGDPGGEGAEVLDARMRCLEYRLRQLDATVELLAAADIAVLDKAVPLVDGLPSPDACIEPNAFDAAPLEPSDPDTKQAVAEVRQRLLHAEALTASGKYREASTIAHEVLRDAEAVAYPPLLVEAKALAGFSMLNLAESPDDTIAMLEAAYFDAVELGHDPIAYKAAARLIPAHANLRDDNETARKWAQHALAVIERHPDPEHRAVVLGYLAHVEIDAGNYDLALELAEETVSLREALYGPDDVRIGASLDIVASALRLRHDFAAALVPAQRTLDIRRRALGDEHPETARALGNLASILDGHGEYEEALRCYREAGRILAISLPPDHPDMSMSLANEGLALMRLRRYDEALVPLQKSLEQRHTRLGPEHPDVGTTLNNIGLVLAAQGQQEEALAHYRDAHRILTAGAGEKHAATLMAGHNIGEALLSLQRPAEALPIIEAVLAGRSEVFGKDSPAVVNTLENLATAQLELGHADVARERLERALSIIRAKPTRLETTGDVLFDLAKLLGEDPSARARARSLAEEAMGIYAPMGPRTAKVQGAIERWLAAHPAP